MANYSSDMITGTLARDIPYGDTSESLLSNDTGGNDKIFGKGGDDDLSGDASYMFDNSKGGNDALVGGAGNDRLYGDAFEMSADSQGTTISFNQGSDLIATVNGVDLTSQANVFAFV